MRPQDNEYAPFYRGYVDLVPEDAVLPVLEAQLAVMRRLPAVVPPEKEPFAYAPDKWSVRQVVGHLGDGERVFGFRAFCFGRVDRTPLPGFDENAYVQSAPFGDAPLADLAAELAHLRAANLLMLHGMHPAQWAEVGSANGHPMSVRALAFVMAGHVRHHLGTLRERYGIVLEG